MPTAAPTETGARLSPKAATAIRTAIRLAGGREVCFVCTLDAKGVIQTARVVARGSNDSVLGLPGIANRADTLVHNHPSGIPDPSQPGMRVAARLHDDGVGFGI